MMKKIVRIILPALILFNACNNKDKKETETTTPATADTTTRNATPQNFDIEKIPVVDKEIGSFPYLAAPEGYEYKYEKNKSYEEKYFYHNDSLVTKIAGQYFFSTLWKKEDNKTDYEKTLLIKKYEDSILQLGAVKIYEGMLPAAARELIEKNKPVYFADLSNNYSARYKQYVLRTTTAKIWLELFIVDNENEIRFSVVQQ